MDRLRSLLGRASTAGVAAQLGGIAELASVVLDGIPDLAGDGRGALGGHERVDPDGKLAERGLDVAILGVSATEEDGVETEKDPGAALEENGRQNDAEPEQNLEARDDGHGRVVVLLDKGANSVSERAGSLARRGGAFGGGGRRADDGQQVGTNVGGSVEGGVDAVGDERKRVLGGNQPDESHHWKC